MQKFWKFRRGEGGEFWGPILENPEGRGVIRQIPFVGVVWLFSGTTQLQKELSIAFYPDLHVFVIFEIAEVYSRLAGWREYEGHLQNERVIKIKTFRKPPKFICINFSLQLMHNLDPFLWKFQDITKFLLEIFVTRTIEVMHPKYR